MHVSCPHDGICREAFAASREGAGPARRAHTAGGIFVFLATSLRDDVPFPLLLLFASECGLIADAKCLFFSYSCGVCGIDRGDKNINGREAEAERQYNTCSFPYTARVFPDDQKSVDQACCSE